MKQFKFISVIFLLMLSLVSRAECSKHNGALENFKSLNTFITSGIQINSASALAHTKDLDIHFIIKKKIKNRATSSESITFKTPYLIKLVDFKIFKNRLIYGIASVYQIQRYTYLHLYQLF
ncbi:hypothetical protein ACHRV1_25800 [Flavobacterium aquidurense]|uniref:Uncharacterized protein n=1 Tax=Flavobacterium piscisymbiosum TaxID=2893753 RepID=A0ABS8MHQ6_9FLAO|nr:hypothetical protein [Flavobacterium sp. F-30]MCC9065021.1 hypothetical protein [Flavobacterium sp. F-30]